MRTRPPAAPLCPPSPPCLSYFSLPDPRTIEQKKLFKLRLLYSLFFGTLPLIAASILGLVSILGFVYLPFPISLILFGGGGAISLLCCPYVRTRSCCSCEVLLYPPVVLELAWCLFRREKLFGGGFDTNFCCCYTCDCCPADVGTRVEVVTHCERKSIDPRDLFKMRLLYLFFFGTLPVLTVFVLAVLFIGPLPFPSILIVPLCGAGILLLCCPCILSRRCYCCGWSNACCSHEVLLYPPVVVELAWCLFCPEKLYGGGYNTTSCWCYTCDCCPPDVGTRAEVVTHCGKNCPHCNSLLTVVRKKKRLVHPEESSSESTRASVTGSGRDDGQARVSKDSWGSVEVIRVSSLQQVPTTTIPGFV